MGKFYKYFLRALGIILSIIIIISMYIHLAPVSFDTGTCSGGYGKYIVDKNSSKLINLFISKQDLNVPQVDVETVRQDIQNQVIKYDVDWHGRKIYMTLKFKLDDKYYTVDFQGQRYWIERFNWKVIGLSDNKLY